MHSFWWIGTAGIIAIEASYVPQIARLWKRKHAQDVSYFFPSLNVLGRMLALSYSMITHDKVFIAGFIVGIVLRSILLAQVTWYRTLRPALENRRSRSSGRAVSLATGVVR